MSRKAPREQPNVLPIKDLAGFGIDDLVESEKDNVRFTIVVTEGILILVERGVRIDLSFNNEAEL